MMITKCDLRKQLGLLAFEESHESLHLSVRVEELQTSSGYVIKAAVACNAKRNQTKS